MEDLAGKKSQRDSIWREKKENIKELKYENNAIFFFPAISL